MLKWRSRSRPNAARTGVEPFALEVAFLDSSISQAIGFGANNATDTSCDRSIAVSKNRPYGAHCQLGTVLSPYLRTLSTFPRSFKKCFCNGSKVPRPSMTWRAWQRFQVLLFRQKKPNQNPISIWVTPGFRWVSISARCGSIWRSQRKVGLTLSRKPGADSHPACQAGQVTD